MRSLLSGAVGSARYADEYPGDAGHARVVVRFRVGAGAPIPGILDTGAPWNVLDPEIAAAHGLAPPAGAPPVTVVIRGAAWDGHLVRGPLVWVADEGEELEIEGTFFVPDVDDEPWLLPKFLGYSGALERLRFAVLPDEQRFVFGPAGD